MFQHVFDAVQAATDDVTRNEDGTGLVAVQPFGGYFHASIALPDTPRFAVHTCT